MAKKGTDLAYWMHGAFMLEAGAKLTEVKGKLARMGYAEQRAFYKVQAREGREPRGYVSQDPEDKLTRLEEEARQNGFAANLWKAHAEEADAKLKLNNLRAMLLVAYATQLEIDFQKYWAYVAENLRIMAQEMKEE